MSRILFTHSYFLKKDPKQWRQQQPYAPLATITAAAVMREAGHGISFFDTMFADNASEIEAELEDWRPDYVVIYDDGFNYLTKMCLTAMRDEALKLTRISKAFGCRVIISSSDSTDHYETYLSAGADFVLLGEAEISLRELISALENDSSADHLSGLAFRKDEKIVNTGKRPVINNLDALPLPAWDLVDIQSYKRMWMRRYGYFSINIATTRGCPYKCNWCAKPIYGNRYNSRSAQHVIAELKMLKETAGFDHVWFCDDIFGLKPGWLQEFSELVSKESLRFRFKIQSRVDVLLKPGTMEHLSAAGCDTIWVGAESGSQKVLDAMDKGTTVEQIYEAAIRIKSSGMRPAFFLQFGYPGETKEDINATLKMLFDLMPDDIGVSVSYPLPGTKFYDSVKEELSAKANWVDSDELALMFRNTYPAAFYKSLHRYVHRQFRQRQAVQALKQIIADPVRISAGKLYKAASWLYYVPASALAGLKLKLSSQ